jgi:hypothetical protein
MQFVGERRRSTRLQRAIRARDVRAADLQAEPTKRIESRAASPPQSRFVGYDEDGGSTANIAASAASHQTQRAQRAEQSTSYWSKGADESITSTTCLLLHGGA